MAQLTFDPEAGALAMATAFSGNTKGRALLIWW
jgi:hypothetical protein